MIFKNSRRTFLLGCQFLLLYDVVAQQPACNTISADMNFTVASVKIKGRWVPEKLQQQVEQLTGLGGHFNPAGVGPAEELIRNEIIKQEGFFPLRLAGSVAVLFITSDICPVADSTQSKQVAITIRPYYLRIDLYNLGNNILPVPRTAKPTFYRQVPPLLLATAPFITLQQDKRYGTSAALQTTTDLLHLPGKSVSPAKARKNSLNLDLNFRQSLNNSFYNLAGALRLVHPVYVDTSLGWNLGLVYARSRDPLGIDNYDKSFTKIFGGLTGKGKGAFFKSYAVGAGVEFSQNKYTLLNNKFENPQTDYGLNALGDGRIGKGFARLGLWFNAAIPKNNNSLKAYRRIAGKFGYAFTIGKGHSNIDVETILSGGHTWKALPAYAGFFAGNSAADFLYTPVNSFNQMPFPDGPVVRSLGEKQGGLGRQPNAESGGTSYWSLNLNFSIPVSGWAKPLIPDIVIQDEPRRITVRSALKGRVNTAKSAIADDLALNGGFSDEAADAAAERIVKKDIEPIISYLADRANVYSFKPVIFFDLGEVKNRNSGNRLWTATGLGLQVNIVNARLQLGYIHTLLPKADDDKGNFLVRFSVQNFY